MLDSKDRYKCIIDGQEVYLTSKDMYGIHEVYMLTCFADYLIEVHNLNSEDADGVAWQVYDLMD